MTVYAHAPPGDGDLAHDAVGADGHCRLEPIGRVGRLVVGDVAEGSTRIASPSLKPDSLAISPAATAPLYTVDPRRAFAS